MAPLPRRPFKALKDQIQEVQINQKAASGRIKSTRISMLFRAVKMLTKGARTKKKSVDKVTQAPRQFPKAVNNSAQKVRATRKSVWNGIRPTPIKIM